MFFDTIFEFFYILVMFISFSFVYIGLYYTKKYHEKIGLFITAGLFLWMLYILLNGYLGA